MAGFWTQFPSENVDVHIRTQEKDALCHLSSYVFIEQLFHLQQSYSMYYLEFLKVIIACGQNFFSIFFICTNCLIFTILYKPDKTYEWKPGPFRWDCVHTSFGCINCCIHTEVPRKITNYKLALLLNQYNQIAFLPPVNRTVLNRYTVTGLITFHTWFSHPTC